MILRCYLLDVDPTRDTRGTLGAIDRADSPWIAAIAPHAMWAQRDWYPRVLELVAKAPFDAFVPVVNEPAPDWQAAGPDHDDVFRHRDHAQGCAGDVQDVSREPEPASPAAVVVRQRIASQVLRDGLRHAHMRAAEVGRVGLMPSIYVIQHARE